MKMKMMEEVKMEAKWGGERERRRERKRAEKMCQCYCTVIYLVDQRVQEEEEEEVHSMINRSNAYLVMGDCVNALGLSWSEKNGKEPCNIDIRHHIQAIICSAERKRERQ